ncbi:MAG: SDR family NAD(P)-dependent oxidoreductase [Solirubrobacterales bacterium]
MRTVVITGTTSGIGGACAARLSASGFRVFAGHRREAGDLSLAAASPRLEPVRLDVTDPDQIVAAAERVDEVVGAEGLWGLINNAGIPVSGPVEAIALDDLRRQLEVNLVGQVAVTQAFLPALRRARGRILNMTSVGGRVATPFMGAYHASKAGLEAISDSLRRELAPLGVDVCVIEPGSVATGIWERGRGQAAEAGARISSEAEAVYGAEMAAALEAANRTGERGIDPDEVAAVAEAALTARRPRARYVVGSDARTMIWGQTLLPARVYDRLMRRAMGLGRGRRR